MGTPLPHERKRMEMIVNELARFLGISGEEAERQVRDYKPEEQLTVEWNNSPHETPAEIREFYQKTDKYLIELTQWNNKKAFWDRVSPLLFYRNKKILEIGAGIGTLSIALAMNGNEVTFFDINEPNCAFARQRFQDRLLPIKMVENLNGLKNYDIIVAIDFFEHIHPEELRPLIKDLSHVLGDGGFIFERSNWYQQQILPMHYDHSSTFYKITEELGFTRRANGDLVKGSPTAGVQVGVITAGDSMKNGMVKALMLMDLPPHSTLTIKQRGGADFARNSIVKELNKDWLFFMDSDQTFAPDALKRLLSWNVDIVSGLVFQRGGLPEPMIYKYEFEKDKGHFYRSMAEVIGDYLLQHKELWPTAVNGAIVLPPAQGLLECDGVSAGCLLVHRRVFDAIEPPWFQWNEDATAGEDFYFCRKAQEAGFKIFADPSVVCGHISQYIRSIEHFHAWAMKEPFPWPVEGVKDV